ncbi:unnamed protein product [Darwinula stevensoni]|uniref:Uncharacterized protein n=1 Tax=Darwinula stevensoni TaxID=69355 RepID=A0A7R9AGR1_9CRUS|nr:unnamed protein product [Darwinula stevensoni]CAG0904287.1 unnamed protein product [Darwinula stevensoni]
MIFVLLPSLILLEALFEGFSHKRTFKQHCAMHKNSFTFNGLLDTINLIELVQILIQSWGRIGIQVYTIQSNVGIELVLLDDLWSNTNFTWVTWLCRQSVAERHQFRPLVFHSLLTHRGGGIEEEPSDAHIQAMAYGSTASQLLNPGENPFQRNFVTRLSVLAGTCCCCICLDLRERLVNRAVWILLKGKLHLLEHFDAVQHFFFLHDEGYARSLALHFLDSMERVDETPLSTYECHLALSSAIESSFPARHSYAQSLQLRLVSSTSSTHHLPTTGQSFTS